MKHIAILGSTGSIGRQTLDVVRSLPDRLQVRALAANENAAQLAQQALEFGVQAVALYNKSLASDLDGLLPRQVDKYYGQDSLELIAIRPDIDIVVVAVAGSVGMRATIAALTAGKDVALATKEVLVAAGEIVRKAAAFGGGRIFPVDSEHSGVLQCLLNGKTTDVADIWLTASGGPFRGWNKEQLELATREQALKHPTWRMGSKITVDSATLMNKGLEMIEARWLFDIDIDRIQVVVHPQSTVHAMVRLLDGSVIAQLGLPDMRLPIQYALLHPERIDTGLQKLNPLEIGNLTFGAVDEECFPSIRLARQASKNGGTMPAVLNASNEAAVDLFLRGKMSFMEISRTVERIMSAHEPVFEPTIEQVSHADHWARHAVYRGDLA